MDKLNIFTSSAKDSCFPFFDLVSSFFQSIAHENALPPMAFCTPTGLYEWFVVPPNGHASPSGFVKVASETRKGLEGVGGSLPRRRDRFRFKIDGHVKATRALSERLRKHSLKLSPSKAHLGATDAEFLDRSIFRPSVFARSRKQCRF